MMEYVRIKFSKHDFLDFRFGGPGLGNLLFIWARAVVYADENSLQILEPNWATFKIGTYLRREKDKRTYGALFKSDGITGFRKYFLQVSTSQLFQNPLIKKVFNMPEVVIFRDMGSQMADLSSHWQLIRHRLDSIISDDVKVLINNKSDFIGVHIRVGDFQPVNEVELRNGKTNTRIPINWYVRQIEKLRDKYGDRLEFRIYSDGSPDELRDVLSIKNIHLIAGGNALSDLVNLSQAKIIVASNSTFSLWASYLGRCNTIWFPGTLRYRLFSENEKAIEVELDYEDDLPTQLDYVYQ